MFNLKKTHLNCSHLKHSLHFFYDEIRACCSNAKGPIFYLTPENENIDWNRVYEIRKKYIKEINSIFTKTSIPDVCKNCCEIKNCLTKEKIKPFKNVVNRIYIQNNMSCNAKCTYCTFGHVEKGYKYKVLPLIKELIEKKILSPNALIYMSGGEITISPEFEELLSMLLNYLNSQIEILTSGIKYCKSIEEAFKQNKCRLVISPDAGCKETYLKIKQVDCFDKVIENIKNYVKASDNAKSTITLKYIIVDNANDNKEEIKKFLDLAKELEIQNVRLDFDYEKYKFSKNIKVPEYYFDLFDTFNNYANEKGLNVLMCDQIQAILDKSH